MATKFEVGVHNWNVRMFHTTDTFNAGQLTHNFREKMRKEIKLFDGWPAAANKGGGKV